MTRTNLLAIAGFATLAIGCDAASTPTGPDDNAVAELRFPSHYCTLATADVTLYGPWYAADALAESPNTSYGQTWCEDFWIVDVISPSVSTASGNNPYWIVGTSNYKPTSSATCNAHKITVRSWGRYGSGAWVKVFDYVAQGSWNGLKCVYGWTPSTPPLVQPGAFTTVRSAVKVTGLLGNKMKATAGVVRN